MVFSLRLMGCVLLICGFLLQNACANMVKDVAMVEVKGGGGEKVVTLRMGKDMYAIPVAYLTPKGDSYPDEIVVIKGSIDIGVTLPSFSGYSENDSLVGEYNPNIVQFSWSESGVGIEYDADRILKNGLEYGLMMRDLSKDMRDMIAYSSLYEEGTMNYVSVASHGSKVIIECYDGSVNDLCKMHYFHKQKNFGVTAVFDRRYLKEWKSIDEKINSLLSDWKVRKESSQVTTRPLTPKISDSG